MLQKFPASPNGWYPDITWSPSNANDVKKQILLLSDEEEDASDYGNADVVCW